MTPILFSDADNTLWDTDAIFRRSHNWLFKEVVSRFGAVTEVKDPLGYVRAIDQELAELHPDHLKYPSIHLVKELVARVCPKEKTRHKSNIFSEIAHRF